jgi:hypothetical protein
MGPSHILFADSNQHVAKRLLVLRAVVKKNLPGQSLLLSRFVVCSVMLPGETISAV